MLDNGTCFVSEEFESFLQANGIKHFTSAPYHPASNGLTDRAVQIVKNRLKKEREGSSESRLARILFMYRITPQSTTGISPAGLLLGWMPHSRLDLVRPNMAKQLEKKQFEQKATHDAPCCFQAVGRVSVWSHQDQIRHCVSAKPTEPMVREREIVVDSSTV